ncbi:uncharacterized protein with HXXEE motif [Pontibacter ummariensis]|uniref:HXXEE domain-containing protein n=1 Tax=Pontibacter ummariensis TaxID=1610492 RepID=A0A239LV20_9BACT|nr:HXXEE domain-containing protein [Pontibacter ummariensis]PRY00369.1 uncharacterized protein with HXXEE motif [Pontibacter ummariensis]SNT34376.1 Protein of unknown function with HXXEE motif-containing protein [Pontibacter ummariensis]
MTTRKDKLGKALKVLPFAFMLHNLEEAVTLTSWLEHKPMSTPFAVTARQYWFALALFTVLGFILLYAKKLYRNERQFLLTAVGFSGMLLLNVFIPHLMGAVLFQEYIPGLLTALTVDLPLSLYIMNRALKSSALSTRSITTAVLAGGLIGISLVYTFLLIGTYL